MMTARCFALATLLAAITVGCTDPAQPGSDSAVIDTGVPAPDAPAPRDVVQSETSDAAAAPDGDSASSSDVTTGDGATATDAFADAIDASDVVAPADAASGPDAAVNCLINADCPTGSYCSGTGCGTGGTCAVKPAACPGIFAPVCGCDNVTYSNGCSASAAGERVASTGACPARDAGVTDASTGSCVSNADCAASEFCMKPVGACAAVGMCAARPRFCSFIFAPVCGCNGMQYTNSCRAQQAGVDVAHGGTCP